MAKLIKLDPEFRGPVPPGIYKKLQHALIDREISNRQAIRALAFAIATGDERALGILDEYNDAADTDSSG